jgi:hypothetical protein
MVITLEEAIFKNRRWNDNIEMNTKKKKLLSEVKLLKMWPVNLFWTAKRTSGSKKRGEEEFELYID